MVSLSWQVSIRRIWHNREVDNMYRQIRVYMDMKGNQLYISFTNFTSTKKLPKVGKLFRTTKGDGYGFGLARIDNIVGGWTAT